MSDIPTAEPSLSGQALSGTVWSLWFSLLNKGITLATQWALAWLLLKEDLGLYAPALFVTSLMAVVGSGHFGVLLVQRQKTFDADVGDALWLSLVLSCAGALFLVAIAPVAAAATGEPGVAPLIRIAALSLPLQPFGNIYGAVLYRALRFKTVAFVHGGVSLLQNGATVALAALGLGAKALMWPLVLVHLYVWIALRLVTGRIAFGRPRPSRWPELLAPCAWLMLNAGLVAAQQNGTGIVVGVFHDKGVTGLFYWGSSMAAQVVFLLANSLTSVFFSSLVKLNGEPERQRRAIVELARLLVAVAAPVCALQAALAEPFFRLLFQERWAPAIPVFEWISIGVLTQPLSVLCYSLLIARSESRLACVVTAGSALAILAACAAGASSGAQATIAVWVGVAMLASNLAAGWVAFARVGLGLGELLRACGTALLGGLLLWVLGAWLVRSLGSLGSLGPLATLAVAGVVLAGLYALLVAFAMPDVRASLAVRLRQLRPARAAEAS